MTNISDEQLDELVSIWLYSNIEAHSFIDNEYWHQNLLFVKESLAGAEIYSYIDKNKIIGFIGLSNNYIAGLFVEKEYRGLGIGTQLLNAVKKEKTALSLAVYEKNIKAVKFYLSQNFEIQNKQTDKNTNQKELIMIWSQN